MTEEQSAAYVMAMAMGGLIEAMGMQAENQQRLSEGKSIVYDDTAFQRVSDARGLNHNAILTMYGR